MLNALPATRPASRLRALLAALLCGLLIGGPAAAPALAQSSLIAPAQTKEEAAQQREAEAEAAAKDAGGTGIGLEAGLAIFGVLIIGGATAYMLRDSRSAVADDERRAAPARAFNPSTARGAPKTMFEGEGRPGGQVGKSKKRDKAKRQKQARRANRPK